MKKTVIISLCLFAIANTLFSQTNNGYIVEYNQPVIADYQVYDPPLRINKINAQSKIDYSTIEGLLQSYLSADNLAWAMSEYLEKPKKIVRDDEHFEAVKKSTIDDYIQLETTYIFNNESRKFAFVKYSMIFEKLPFAWTNMMILENKNNRWYISGLINQNQVLFLLGNANNQFLIDCFNGKSTDKDVEKIIKECTVNKQLSMRKLSLEIDKFDDRLKKKFFDERITNKNTDFRNAQINSSKTKYESNVTQPFLINQFEISEYGKSDKNLLKNVHTDSLYRNMPEHMLLDTLIATDLLSKAIIDDYCIIKYKQNDKIQTKIINEQNIQYNFLGDFVDIFAQYKTSFIMKLFDNIKEEYAGSSGGINIDELIGYVKSNERSFMKNMEKHN